MPPPFNSFPPQARPQRPQHQHQHQQHQQHQQQQYSGYQQHNGYQNPRSMNSQMMMNPMMAHNMVPMPNMNHPQFFNNIPQQQQQQQQQLFNQLLPSLLGNLMAQSLPLQPNFFQPPPPAFPSQPPPPQFNSFNPRPYPPVPTPHQNHQPPRPQGQSVETSNNINNFRSHYTNQQKFKRQGQGFQRPHLHQADNAKKKFGFKKDGKGNYKKVVTVSDGADGDNTPKEKKRSYALRYTRKEVGQWRDARRKNYPTDLNVQKKLKKNFSDKAAKMRRRQLQQVLANQAELGVEVAEVPEHYLSKTDEQVEDKDGERNNRHKKRRRASENSSEESSMTTRGPTLLQKLLSGDIKREKSQLLQVFRFIVINSFFKELPEKPLKLPLVMVEETGCEHDREWDDLYDDVLDDANGDDDSCDKAV